MKMDCDFWQEKIDAFVDDELTSNEARDFEVHMHGCPACSAETAARQRLKIETRYAGQRYAPSAELQARIEKQIGVQPRIWNWWPALAGATAVLLALIVIGVTFGQAWQKREVRRQLVAQLVDQHVSLLAANGAVDVVSTDRHTVKPWFAGKVPFSVDIPDLQNTPYTLIGGKFTYFQQAPAAQLLFGLRKHKISVFMFRDHGETSELGDETAPVRRLGFEVQTWTEDGVRYLAISDASADDVQQLCQLLKAAS
jgi:anti-sigma factor RsiW